MTTIAPPQPQRVIAPCAYKALDAETRTFEALTATWDLDLGDDVIHRGAFADSIKAWQAGGQVKHLLDSHNTFTIRAAIGKLLDAAERKDGVWTKWRIIDGTDGDEALNRLRAGVVESMSIGYVPLESDKETDKAAARGVRRNIRALDWRESSLVLFPMNPNALIDSASVKALVGQGLQTKALPAEHLAALTELHATLGVLLAPKASPAPDSDGLSGFSALDALRLRRLRSHTAFLRGDTDHLTGSN